MHLSENTDTKNPIFPFDECKNRLASENLRSLLNVNFSEHSTSHIKAPSKIKQTETLMKKANAMILSEDSRKELIFRIEKGLILNPEQLDPKIIRPDITEAKGLNYNSKLRLIEMALLNKDMLEFFLSGQETPLLLNPVRVHKKEGGTSDLLEAKQIPGEKTLSIGINKARLIRRLRGSLFNKV